MDPVALSVCAALIWGVADFGAGLVSRRASVLIVTAGMLLVGGVASGAVISLSSPPGVEERTVALAALAGGVTAIGLAALYRALALGPMSVVAPISAAGVIIPVIAGLATGDQPSLVQLVGVVAAIAGMFIVVSRSEDATGPDNAAGIRYESIVLAVVAAVGLGIYYLAADAVSDGQTNWFIFSGQIIAGVALTVAVLVRRPPLPERRQAAQIVILGFLGLSAWVLSTAAVRSGQISLTTTVTSLYPLVTVLLAIGLTGESLDRIQTRALAATFLGVVMIAAG